MRRSPTPGAWPHPLQPASQSSSARVTRALKLLPVERARVRTRRTSPTGNLTVNTTVGSGTNTPCGGR
jgi:hypothetical protein